MHLDRNLRWTLGLGLALLPILVQPAVAEEAPVANARPAAKEAKSNPTARGALPKFAEFLDRNPGIEARLRENPALLNSRPFQRNHPQIAEFLAQNPTTKAELAAKPRWFVHREMTRQAATPTQVAQVDRFLDQHPGVEKELAQQPQLLRDADFLNSKPELRELVKTKPGADRAGDSKPGKAPAHGNKSDRPDKPKGKP